MSILPIFIPHAGCPHQCVFCNQKKISGQHSAALASAREQIARWRSWLRPSLAHEAAFYGGSFTGLPLELQRELLQLTDELLAEGFIGSVRLSTRPDYIDAERLQLLKEHHVELVELGVQSLDDKVLQAEDFSLEVGAGEFSSCGAVTAKSCVLQVGAGTLDIDMLDTQKLSADCGTGEISLIMAGKEKDYDYELTCGIGEIDLGDSEYSGFGIEKTISNDGASRSMVLECGMGEIDVEFGN